MKDIFSCCSWTRDRDKDKHKDISRHKRGKVIPLPMSDSSMRKCPFHRNLEWNSIQTLDQYMIEIRKALIKRSISEKQTIIETKPVTTLEPFNCFVDIVGVGAGPHNATVFSHIRRRNRNLKVLVLEASSCYTGFFSRIGTSYNLTKSVRQPKKDPVFTRLLDSKGFSCESIKGLMSMGVALRSESGIGEGLMMDEYNIPGSPVLYRDMQMQEDTNGIGYLVELMFYNLEIPILYGERVVSIVKLSSDVINFKNIPGRYIVTTSTGLKVCTNHVCIGTGAGSVSVGSFSAATQVLIKKKISMETNSMNNNVVVYSGIQTLQYFLWSLKETQAQTSGFNSPSTHNSSKRTKSQTYMVIGGGAGGQTAIQHIIEKYEQLCISPLIYWLLGDTHTGTLILPLKQYQRDSIVPIGGRVVDIKEYYDKGSFVNSYRVTIASKNKKQESPVMIVESISTIIIATGFDSQVMDMLSSFQGRMLWDSVAARDASIGMRKVTDMSARQLWFASSLEEIYLVGAAYKIRDLKGSIKSSVYVGSHIEHLYKQSKQESSKIITGTGQRLSYSGLKIRNFLSGLMNENKLVINSDGYSIKNSLKKHHQQSLMYTMPRIVDTNVMCVELKGLIYQLSIYSQFPEYVSIKITVLNKFQFKVHCSTYKGLLIMIRLLNDNPYFRQVVRDNESDKTSSRTTLIIRFKTGLGGSLIIDDTSFTVEYVVTSTSENGQGKKRRSVGYTPGTVLV